LRAPRQRGSPGPAGDGRRPGRRADPVDVRRPRRRGLPPHHPQPTAGGRGHGPSTVGLPRRPAVRTPRVRSVHRGLPERGRDRLHPAGPGPMTRRTALSALTAAAVVVTLPITPGILRVPVVLAFVLVA